MKILNVLLVGNLNSNNKVAIVSERNDFVNVPNTIYKVYDSIPDNVRDNSELILFIHDDIKTMGLEGDINYNIMTQSDMIYMHNDKVFDREYDIYPVIQQDCYNDGTVADSDKSVQLLMYHPYRSLRPMMLYPDRNAMENANTIADWLVSNGHVDNNCDINIFSTIDPSNNVEYCNWNVEVEHGLISPATIVGDED